jgi:hypothetical protein
MALIKRLLFIPLFLLLIGIFFAPKAHAALSNVADTINTSRPSASAPLFSAQVGGSTVGQVTIIDNGSMFLASDSAVLQSDTGQGQNVMTVASMSAQQVGPPVQRNVYFTSAISNAHHAGTALVTNVTATHIIELTPGTLIPNGGKIVITFPGAGSNIASPSATGFSFNNLQTTAVICNPTSACAGGVSVSAPTVTVTTNALQPAASPIYIAIGCTGTLNVSGGFGNCTVYAPALINPTVSSNATCPGNPTVCNADIWKLQIQTQDTGSVVLETSRIVIGTINAVQVYATVEPTMTFSIAGLTAGTNWGGGSGAVNCGNENTNTGIDTSATVVNFGSLNNGNFSKAAQVLTVSDNGSYGYDIIATSSGRLINTSSGVWLPDANGGNGLTANDTPAPMGIKNASGSAFFGISPCGNDVPAIWGGASHIANNSNFSNPWNTGVNGFAGILATYSGSNVNGNDATHGLIVVRYVASIASNTPAGLYTTALTYVATPNF